MAEPRDDEFYVGYLPRAPRRVTSRVRLGVLLILALAVAVPLVLVGAQGRFATSVFEFGVNREFTGVVRERPYPMLLVRRPGRSGETAPYSTYLLTVFGKRGASAAVAGLDGRQVKLTGSLIYRDERTMIEVQPDSIETLASDAAPEPVREQDLGIRTLIGEIVDSKCFLGVMKPGNLKPHRSCAARCISGGVPPMLLVRDAEGRATYFLLVSESGQSVNDRVLSLVAEPVEITGRVIRTGDLLVLRADPGALRRLSSR